MPGLRGGVHEAVERKPNQSILWTVAYICLLLGFFGTDSSMIKALNVISQRIVEDLPLLTVKTSGLHRIAIMFQRKKQQANAGDRCTRK